MTSHLKLPSRKSSNDGETLICSKLFVETCLMKTVKLLLEEASDANMRRISLSSDTIQRRISDMPEDVKDQVINESISNSNIFFSSGFVNRCYFMCSVACFRKINSFRKH